jgi:hypothetical protein
VSGVLRAPVLSVEMLLGRLGPLGREWGSEDDKTGNGIGMRAGKEAAEGRLGEGRPTWPNVSLQ